MAGGPIATVLQYLRSFVGGPPAEDTSDAELLERFARHADEAAFEALVRRYGPMVWGVCRRVLTDEHAAEDAFQATFLALVRKAASIRKREVVGSWLYGVAYRTARKAERNAAGWYSRERRIPEMAVPDPA